MNSGMSDIYILVCGGIGGIVAVLLLVIVCAIVSMIIAFCSYNPPSRIPPGLHLRRRDSGRNVRDGYVSQKSVPGGV